MRLTSLRYASTSRCQTARRERTLSRRASASASALTRAINSFSTLSRASASTSLERCSNSCRSVVYCWTVASAVRARARTSAYDVSQPLLHHTLLLQDSPVTMRSLRLMTLLSASASVRMRSRVSRKSSVRLVSCVCCQLGVSCGFPNPKVVGWKRTVPISWWQARTSAFALSRCAFVCSSSVWSASIIFELFPDAPRDRRPVVGDVGCGLDVVGARRRLLGERGVSPSGRDGVLVVNVSRYSSDNVGETPPARVMA